MSRNGRKHLLPHSLSLSFLSLFSTETRIVSSILTFITIPSYQAPDVDDFVIANCAAAPRGYTQELSLDLAVLEFSLRSACASNYASSFRHKFFVPLPRSSCTTPSNIAVDLISLLMLSAASYF